jgi:hypothetical protein
MIMKLLVPYMKGNSSVARRPMASKEGLSSMELVRFEVLK